MERKKIHDVFLTNSLRGLLLSSAVILLTACGGGSDDDSTESTAVQNTVPVAGANTVTIQSGGTTTYGLNVSDADNDKLTYTVKTSPEHGTASVDTDGTVTHSAANYIGSDTLVIEASDGSATVDIAIDITLQAEPAFDYQFYRTQNPDIPGTDQIVRYDPNNPDETTNQVVIKQGAILNNKVFVMSGAKSGDSTLYVKREYAVFQEQGAYRTTRQTNDEPPVEYAFYTDTELKSFDARNTNLEKVIYRGSMLTAAMKQQGVEVISGDYYLHTTETDIDNSYVQLKAFDELPDLLRSETDGSKTQLPVVVRISDSTAVQGHMISTVLDNNGAVEKVLINDLGAYTDATKNSVPKMLKVCNAALSNCSEIAGTDGIYYLLAKNNSTVYMAKEGDSKIYAFSASDESISEVSGVTYPAAYNGAHHQIAFNGGHGGGSGILSDFYNMPNVVETLSEGDTSYLLINYNFDTQDKIGDGLYSNYGFLPYVHKNALVLKLSGTGGIKVYDNGTGVDLMNESDEVEPSYNMSLTAVKDGYLYLEASKFNGSESKNFNYLSGWLNTNTETTKTVLDNVVVEKDVPYFTAIRVPPVAVGDHVYASEDSYLEGETSGAANRIYNIYKMPFSNTALAKDDASVEHVTGRMYFERKAYRNSGVYEGNVLLWDRHDIGRITNVTTSEVIGIATEDVDEGIQNVTAGRGGATLSGIGGLFGMHMHQSHGSTPILASGESETEGSLKAVNQISGSWITD